jgi:ABC-2 type transport system permease protein
LYTLKLILRSYSMYLKSTFEYRPAFVTDMITVIIAYLVSYLGIWILLDKFKIIEGWTLYEVMLLFNLNLTAYSLTSFAFRTPMLEDIEDMVRMGRFDIVLIRPVNSLVYMLLGRATAGYFGQLSLATVIFVLCFANLDIQWTVLKVIYFIFTIIGGTMIQASIYLVLGSLCFWVTRHNALWNTVMGDCREFINYPISIYGKIFQFIFTLVLPFAFINFYPATYLLDKSGVNLFHPMLQFGTPLVGIIAFLLAYKFWKIGVNRYESTGS